MFLVKPVELQWNSPFDTTSSDPRQYGDGRGEVMPSLDGTDFRQYERRVRLSVSNTRVAPERRAGRLLERLEGRAFASLGKLVNEAPSPQPWLEGCRFGEDWVQPPGKLPVLIWPILARTSSRVGTWRASGATYVRFW